MYGKVTLECMGVIQCNVWETYIGMYGEVTVESRRIVKEDKK